MIIFIKKLEITNMDLTSKVIVGHIDELKQETECSVYKSMDFYSKTNKTPIKQ